MKQKEFILQYLQKHGFRHFNPKAVLFDMDGVIYDSMPKHATAWHESMAQYGLDMAPEDAYRYEGMRGVETIKLIGRQQWNREIDDSEAEMMYKVKSEHFARLEAPRKMDGIMQLMNQIHQDGLTIGIVTGSGQRTLLDRLEKDFNGVIERQHIVTSYDVNQGKPAPDPYLAGMKKTETKPWQTIVVENAPLGIQAGVAAGCFVIAVNTGPLPDEELLSAGADYILHTIKELCNCWPMILEDLSAPVC